MAKEKAIYNALNYLKLRGSTYIGFVWVPTEYEPKVAAEMGNYNEVEFSAWRSPSGKELPPPTSFKNNDVLSFYAALTNMFKTASYGEVNPSIYSIVTLPFLYGVMYGDYGHGILMTLLGIVMCIAHSRSPKHPSTEGMFMLRYFILTCGIFSIWNGLIYNEFFAVYNDWFGTCYNVAEFSELKEE